MQSFGHIVDDWSTGSFVSCHVSCCSCKIPALTSLLVVCTLDTESCEPSEDDIVAITISAVFGELLVQIVTWRKTFALRKALINAKLPHHLPTLLLRDGELLRITLVFTAAR